MSVDRRVKQVPPEKGGHGKGKIREAAFFISKLRKKIAKQLELLRDE